jgi:hypothetical protein
MNKFEAFNSSLEVMCSDNDCDFINNSPAFTLGDGSINDGYLDSGKGPLLSKAGQNKLAQTLKLRVRIGISDVTLRQIDNQTHRKKHNNRSYANRHDNHNKGGRWSQQNSRNYHGPPSVNNPRYNDDVIYSRDACYYCNENGHSTENCRHQEPITCHDCRQKGHKSKHHRSPHSYNTIDDRRH